MTNITMFWAICLSLDAPLLHVTPLGPTRCWPHTSHLPSVVDNEEVVDGGLSLWGQNLEEKQGVCFSAFHCSKHPPTNPNTTPLTSAVSSPPSPVAVPVQTCALSPASLLTDSLSYEGVFL